MKHLSHLASWLILILNFIFIAGLLIAAYSPYIDPVAHPVRACMGLTFPVFVVINLLFCLFWLVFKLKFLIFSLFAFLITFTQLKTYLPVNFPTSTVPEKSIKFLSYNVMGFADLRKSAENNEILNYIRQSNADIVCIQEYAASGNEKHLTQKAIQTYLKDYPYFIIQKIGKNESNALACYSKYPIIFAEQIKYQSTYNGSVLYKVLIENDTVTIINNHLESNKLTKEDRRIYEDMITAPETDKFKSGIKHLVNKLGEAMAIRAVQSETISGVISSLKNSDIIVCGDFNDSPISYTHRVISKELDDTFVKSGIGLGVSYNQNRFYFRIDHILISKSLRSYNCTVDRSISVSDHYPIWCYITKR